MANPSSAVDYWRNESIKQRTTPPTISDTIVAPNIVSVGDPSLSMNDGLAKQTIQSDFVEQKYSYAYPTTALTDTTSEIGFIMEGE